MESVGCSHSRASFLTPCSRMDTLVVILSGAASLTAVIADEAADSMERFFNSFQGYSSAL